MVASLAPCHESGAASLVTWGSPAFPREGGRDHRATARDDYARIGNEEYARDNGSFGLPRCATARDRQRFECALPFQRQEWAELELESRTGVLRRWSSDARSFLADLFQYIGPDGDRRTSIQMTSINTAGGER